MKRKLTSFALAFLMMMSSLLTTRTTAEVSSSRAMSDEKDIKSTIERFISEDYNFNGGKNIFSTVNNENLKRYLLLRNEGGSRGPGGHKIKYGSRLDLGDLCFLHNGSSWFHTYIVVRPGSNFGVAAHTKDRYNVPINEAGKIPNTSRDYKRAYVHLATLN